MNSTKRNKKIYALIDAGGDMSKTWYVETYRTGKREKFTRGINVEKTKEGRREAARLLINELKASFTPPPPNQSQIQKLRLAYERWAPTVQPSSRTTYKTKLDDLINWLDGRFMHNELLRDFFCDYAKDHAQTTTYGTLIMLKLFFKHAGLDELLEGIKMKDGEHKPLKYFQPYQQARLEEHLSKNDPELWLYCQFIYFCFIRPRAELRFLKVGDLFFEERKIRVPGNHSKNNKTQFVKIPRQFAPQLEHLMSKNPNEYIFPGRYNPEVPVGRNLFGNRFRKILDALGFNEDYQLYSWKHTGVVNCANAGVPIVKLMHQLRHHSLDETYKYMRQLGIQDMEDLADLFPAIGRVGKGKELANFFLVNKDGLIIKLENEQVAKSFIHEQSVHVIKTIYTKGEIKAVALRAANI